MSDDDFMMDSGGEEEDYDFQYEEDDDEESGDVDIENKYYNAKQMKQTDPKDAIEEFLGVVALEPEKGDWYEASFLARSRLSLSQDLAIDKLTIHPTGVLKVSNRL